MAQPVLGVIVAFEHEAARVRRRMHVQYRETAIAGRLWKGNLYGHEVVLLRCGMGAERAAQAMTWLLQSYRLAGAISVGFAGALHASLATGDAILPQHVVSGSANATGTFLPLSETIKPDARWTHIAARAATQAALVLHCGPLLSVAEVVLHAAGKAYLGQNSGALAVDMETYSIGRIATAHNVPFAVLRTIFDARDDTIPLQVKRFTTPEGEFQPARLMHYLLAQPRLLPQTLPLWRKARRAGSCLEQWLHHFFTLLPVDRQ
jgi:adenosylhomocysteine nucleosidase